MPEAASGAPADCRIPNVARLTPHEEDRLPLLRPLDALAAVADPLGGRRAAAVHRSGGRRPRSWARTGPISASTISPASSPRRFRCSPRSAPRPAASRSARRSSICATRTRCTWPRTPARPTSSPAGGCSWDQPRLARAGDRWLALFRLSARRRPERRRHGPAPRGGVPRHAARRGLRAAEPAADVPQSARPAAPRAPFGRACATGSGGAPAPTPRRSGRRSSA